MLYIDPQQCIDCGACALVCPVDAIAGIPDVPPFAGSYGEVNAGYFEQPSRRVHPSRSAPNRVQAISPPKTRHERARLRVAIVGAGPAAGYAAEALCDRLGIGVEVFLLERLSAPWGLARFGVAPDHASTRRIVRAFERTAQRPQTQLFLNVDVGKDVSHEELLRHHHAVIYAVGAAHPKTLDIPGEALTGVGPATDFAAWYNGHPEKSNLAFDLSCERAVVIGNGNVALDVARMLVSDADDLATTDIPAYALDALRHSKISEVVVVGRRGPDQAAYTLSEITEVAARSDVDVVVNPNECIVEPVVWARRHDERSFSTARKVDLVRALPPIGSSAPPMRKRIVLRFGLSPAEFIGDAAVQAVKLVRNVLALGHGGEVVAVPSGETESVSCGLVLNAVGYQAQPVPGLPFDAAAGRVPNEDGRVLEFDRTKRLPGVYVTGWVKRGPSGYLGTNRLDAQETVDSLIADYEATELPEPESDQRAFESLLLRCEAPAAIQDE